jgi:ABC-2 type transport system permease protein
MAAIALSSGVLAVFLAGPFINVLAIADGPHWLAGYGVILAMGGLSTALAITLTIALFRLVGPKRTRLIAQIVSALVGAAFIIGIQAAAILSMGSLSRFSFLNSEAFLASAPGPASSIWLLARAAMGSGPELLAIFAISIFVLALVISRSSIRFGDHVIAALGVSESGRVRHRPRSKFRAMAPRRTLRHKEWTLLRRDPWLMSQTLMQILYLLPPALLLWRFYADDIGALFVLVPVLVMAAGQLAGGLAWLAVSGEDAPDLVATAPIPPRAIVLAKIEAVLGAVFVVISPLLIALLWASPRFAIVGALGVVVGACSATSIQIWFRSQAKRSHFRRRQTSSRIATLTEAVSSVLWAGTAALVALGSWVAVITACVALFALTCAWAVRPRPTVA